MLRQIKNCAWHENGEPCINMCEGTTDFCASHNAAQRKATRQKVKVVSPVKKITQKRASEQVEYIRLKKEYLEAFPVCEVVECHRKATEIHHMQGRENEKLLDVNNFLAVCDVCHQRITVDSAWAISQGYSILRSVSKTNETI